MAKARDKDQYTSRPILTAMHVKAPHVVAADGFRLHVWEDGQATLPDGDWQVANLKAGSSVVTIEPIEGTFPDWAMIMPRREPTAVVCLNTKYLVDACAGHEYVTIKVHRPDQPVEVIGQADQHSAPRHYALVMPVHLNKGETWRPLPLSQEQRAEIAARVEAKLETATVEE